MNKNSQLGRLALRVEGEFWNACYAKTDTMDGAVLLGSIHMNIVTENAACKQAFMDLMQEAVGDIIKGIVGITPNWNAPQSAPETERAGRA